MRTALLTNGVCCISFTRKSHLEELHFNLEPVTDKKVYCSLQFLSLKERQIDMYGHRLQTDGLCCHNLGDTFHLLFHFRRIPTGAEIMFPHDFIEQPQRFSVHMEKVLKKGVRPDFAHVGKDVPVQQRVSIAEIAQITPVHFAASDDDVARIDVPMQAGSGRFHLIEIANKPGLDIVWKSLTGGEYFLRTQWHTVKDIRVTGDGVQGFGVVGRRRGQFLQPLVMVGNDSSKGLFPWMRWTIMPKRSPSVTNS